jgi:hypothetical protein
VNHKNKYIHSCVFAGQQLFSRKEQKKHDEYLLSTFTRVGIKITCLNYVLLDENVCTYWMSELYWNISLLPGQSFIQHQTHTQNFGELMKKELFRLKNTKFIFLFFLHSRYCCVYARCGGGKQMVALGAKRMMVA